MVLKRLCICIFWVSENSSENVQALKFAVENFYETIRLIISEAFYYDVTSDLSKQKIITSVEARTYKRTHIHRQVCSQMV